MTPEDVTLVLVACHVVLALCALALWLRDCEPEEVGMLGAAMWISALPVCGIFSPRAFLAYVAAGGALIVYGLWRDRLALWWGQARSWRAPW